MLKIKIIFIIFILFAGFLFSEEDPKVDFPDIPPAGVKWVDSVLHKLTPEQRIAQLFMVAAYSNMSLKDNEKVTELVKTYNIGGICFFQGGPLTQARYTNYWQSVSQTPLFIAIDGEWGVGMRLKDSAVSFPRQMTLGAVQDNKLIYAMGEEIGTQCKRLGIHINFAPVVDINSNPANPVINSRSFGEDKKNVAAKALSYMKGMQDKGVIATAKHFPGHGDTDKDSHTTLPVIHHARREIDSVDLYPFRKLISNGLSAVMAGHLFVPELDTTSNQPSSLSKKVVHDVLISQMGFKGLIFTDALGMKGASENSKPGEMELKALLAGNDILLMSEDVPLAITYIKNAIDSGQITQKFIDDRCKKVLTFKYKAGLAKYKPVKLKNLYADLNNIKSKIINTNLYQASVTIVKNTFHILPVKNLENQKIAEISFNADSLNTFAISVDNYAPVKHFSFDKTFDTTAFPELKEQLAESNLVVITVHQTSFTSSNNYGFSPEIIRFIGEIKKSKRVILNLLCNPYALAKLSDTSEISAILVSYQGNKSTQKISAEAIFGGINVNGRLPVTASAQFPVRTGFKTNSCRFTYTFPEMSGVNESSLFKIDSIAKQGIKNEIYPGCQILIARNGQVFYNKSFGYHTYDKTTPVKNSDLYDVASLTKVLATTVAVMKLYEEGKINIDTTLGFYLPQLGKSDKAGITLRNLMIHQAGLKAWIPFYKKTFVNDTLDSCIYKPVRSDDYPYRVADSLYINKNYKDSVFKEIINSELRATNDYVYSDLGFYLLKDIIERITGEPLVRYLKKHFYESLGLSTLCYQPLNYFDTSRIVPSEIDTAFRKQLLWGDVNDPGAAMLGGIGGHAGIFSNANDIAILMQMLLNEGDYGDHRYLMPATIEKFTSYQTDDSRRGLGFDKPVRDKSQGGPTCPEASSASYGHSGFTGTYVWVDPEYKLVYVFLSNRTYPYSANNKLVTSGIRTEIQKVIYKAIMKAKKG
ncbi:MAG TPA: glycoside hydrolase family 3 N-terminal domain-containing protein [Bacteroidales bacterium]|nr:glycoside hydrolase family 3 N-terminal domain-containing protein [Bacteroidales bacterium]